MALIRHQCSSLPWIKRCRFHDWNFAIITPITARFEVIVHVGPMIGDICDIQFFVYFEKNNLSMATISGWFTPTLHDKFRCSKNSNGVPSGNQTWCHHMSGSPLDLFPMSFKGVGILPPILPSLLPTPRYKVWKKCLKRKTTNILLAKNAIIYLQLEQF